VKSLLNLMYSQKSLTMSKLFRRDFDLLDYQKPIDFSVKLNDLTGESDTMEEIFKWIENLTFGMKYIEAIEEYVPNYKTYTIAQEWVKAIRPLTEELVRDHHTVQGNDDLIRILLKDCELTINLLKTISKKDGLLGNSFKFELDFLDMMFPIAKMKGPYYLAMVTRGFQMFSNVHKDELQETYFSLVYKQGKLGSWRGKDDIGILKMTSTIVDVLLQGVSKRTNDPRLQKSIPV
jgi:hypothetical protein